MLGDMTPRLTAKHVLNCSFGHSVGSGHVCHEPSIIRGHPLLSHLAHDALGQLRVRMLFAGTGRMPTQICSSLSSRIAVIVGNGSKPKMAFVATRGVVACVANRLIARVFACGKQICHAVSLASL